MKKFIVKTTIVVTQEIEAISIHHAVVESELKNLKDAAVAFPGADIAVTV